MGRWLPATVRGGIDTRRSEFCSTRQPLHCRTSARPQAGLLRTVSLIFQHARRRFVAQGGD